MTENLPANATPRKNLKVTSLSLAVWIAPLPKVREWLDEAPMSAEHIAQRLCIVTINYYVPPMTDVESKAWIMQWVQSLRSIPARFTADAFDHWFSHETKRPTFADIGNYARKNMADARRRIREAEPHEPEPENAITAEEMERRRAIIAEYGYTAPRLQAIPKGGEPCPS